MESYMASDYQTKDWFPDAEIEAKAAVFRRTGCIYYLAGFIDLYERQRIDPWQICDAYYFSPDVVPVFLAPHSSGCSWEPKGNSEAATHVWNRDWLVFFKRWLSFDLSCEEAKIFGLKDRSFMCSNKSFERFLLWREIFETCEDFRMAIREIIR